MTNQRSVLFMVLLPPREKKKKRGLWLTFGRQRFIIEQHTFSSPCQPIMWSRAIQCEAIHVNSYEFKTTPRTLIIRPNFLVYLTHCWKTSAVYVQTSTTKLPARVWGFAWSCCLEVIRARRHVAIGWLTTRRNLFDDCDAHCLTELLSLFKICKFEAALLRSSTSTSATLRFSTEQQQNCRWWVVSASRWVSLMDRVRKSVDSDLSATSLPLKCLHVRYKQFSVPYW